MALPNGYKRLEYIESTGTQYIDTEYYPRWNTRIVDEIKMSAYSSTKAAFGTRNANSATASKAFAVFQTGANTFRADYFGSSKTITLDVSTDQRLTIDMNKNVCAIGGKTVTNTAITSGEATYTMMLFTYSNSGKAGGLSSMRRYSTKVYEGDALVRNYIPCKTSSGEVGLWEDVEGVFRGNDGEGTFVAGPEFVIGTDGLPSGYKRLEYIEAEGNSWFDTGFTPNQDSRIVLDFAATTLDVTTGVKSNCLVGSRENTTSQAFALNITTEGYYRFGYNDSSPTTTVAGDTNRHTADMNKNVLSLDGTVIYTATYGAFSGYGSVYIGQIHAKSNNYYKGYVRIYGCQIYDNGTLVRDYVPCQNTAGQIGLWDNLNGVFGGSSGPDPFVTAPEIGVDRFPINYRRLSCIESTGTQYIDTGFKPNQDTRVVAKVRCIVGTAANYIFGARYALSQQNYSFFASKNSHYAFIYNTKQVNFDKSANTDEPFVIDFNKNVATIGNNSVSGTYATFAAPVNLFLFGLNSPDKIIYGSSRIYSCQIYDNGTLVRDYIPCETDDGEIGLWDTVELRFYGNAGSGSFVNPMTPHDGQNTNIGGVAREIEAGTILIGGVSREFKKGTVRIGGVLRDLVLKTEIFTITTTGKLGGYCKVTADGTSLTAGKTYEVEEDTQITVVVYSDYVASTLPGSIYLNGTLLDSTKYTFSVTSNVTIEGLDNYTSYLGGGHWGQAKITTE